MVLGAAIVPRAFLTQLHSTPVSRGIKAELSFISSRLCDFFSPSPANDLLTVDGSTILSIFAARLKVIPMKFVLRFLATAAFLHASLTRSIDGDFVIDSFSLHRKKKHDFKRIYK